MNFDPAAAELDFGSKEDRLPKRLGKLIWKTVTNSTLTGRIDRVDLWRVLADGHRGS